MAKQAHRVCRVSELPPGERKIVDVGRFSIGVFNIDGEFYALRNVCPHQLAPLCKGRISGTTLPSDVGEYRYAHAGEIIHCPWHKWEFNIKTGRSVFNPHKLKVATYEVSVEREDGSVETRDCGSDDPDPTVETFPVVLEDGEITVLA